MAVELDVLDDLSAKTPSDQGFLKVRRLRLQGRAPDGTPGEAFRYDMVDRAALDAVAVVLWSPRAGHADDPWVCVRRQLRPPLLTRRGRDLPVPDPHDDLSLWELPAGLIEPGERGEEGVLGCARRETEEETGFDLPLASFARLGGPMFLSPGMCAEKIHVVRAQVPDPFVAVVALGDGPVEQGSEVAWWPLSECLARAADGRIEDAKTEIGLWRLRAALGRGE